MSIRKRRAALVRQNASLRFWKLGNLGSGPTGSQGLNFSNSFWTMAPQGHATSSFAITSSESGIPVAIPSASMSLSFWLFGSGTAPNIWGSAGSTRTLLGLRNSAGGAGLRENSFWFQGRPGNGQQLEWGISDDPDAITICGRMNSPLVNEWHHYLLVWDGSGSANNDRAKIFLDGSGSNAITSYVGTIPQVLLTSSMKFFIGAQMGVGTLGQSLVINNLGIYNTALTSSHSLAQFNNGSPVDLRTITGSEALVHYYSDFPVSGSTTILTDLITNFAGVTPMDLQGRGSTPNYFTSSGTPVFSASNGSMHDPWG